MLPTILLSVFSAVLVTINGADPPGGYYTTRYDHFDIENILNQKRLVLYYAACLLDKGPCPPQGTEFKSILPEAIKTNCLRCTEKQRIVITNAIKRLRKEYPDIWGQLEKRWDPTGENVKRLMASVNKPIPVSEIPLLFDRFGDDLANDQTRVDGVTENVETRSTSEPTTSTTTSATTTTTTSTPTTRARITTSTTVPPTSTFRMNYKPVTAGPFNSIGPNLMVINPQALINKVLFTADVLLNTVTGALKG
ncbi:hypothetical protein Trydic_g23721 [Trypoxylus dichotomus]